MVCLTYHFFFVKVLAGQKINADLTSALGFVLAESLIGTYLSIIIIFLLGYLLAIDHHFGMFYAWHPTRLVARFKQIRRTDRELNFRAVTVPAMTPMTHYHIELHLNCSLRSFCIYYNRLVNGCQVKYFLI